MNRSSGIPAMPAILPSLRYIPNFVTSEQGRDLVQKIDSLPWSTELSRRTQQYGFKYDYAKPRSQPVPIDPFPDWLVELSQRVQGITAENFNQVIINEYQPGQGIAPHIDNPKFFGDVVCSLSLGSGANMTFEKGSEKRDVYLEVNSLVVLEGEARHNWTHGISPRKTDDVGGKRVARGRRVSITFRRVK